MMLIALMSITVVSMKLTTNLSPVSAAIVVGLLGLMYGWVLRDLAETEEAVQVAEVYQPTPAELHSALAAHPAVEESGYSRTTPAVLEQSKQKIARIQIG